MARYINGKLVVSSIVSSGATFLNGSTITLYNTADTVTNYERLRASFTSNVATVIAEVGGTGTSRILRLASGLTKDMYLDAGGNFLLRNIDSANATVATIASATGYARFGDATAPTVSLEAANGLRLAAGSMAVTQGAAIILYNTADEVTNYERLRMYWSSNAFRIYSEKGGTGTARTLRIGTAGGGQLSLEPAGIIRGIRNDGEPSFTIDSNTNKARFGDTTAPTVSLEAANGFALAAGDMAIATGLAITAPNIDDNFVILKARDNGSGQVEIARLEGDAEPRFCHTRPINLLGAAASELTIATGAITIVAGYHTVDTEADAASDNLDTISGGRTGDILVILPANAARTVVAKHGTGNLNLAAGADFTMDEDDDFLTLLFIGATWQEISRSENHA